ncbi:MAG: glycoside hydrolase family 97 catalytic domain-containing protein, partial [Bacteroidaceae bacterium]|nr:glycoside hydrolase family 97 catalytic domain-containing protein [Bacteroidaceae bacterium]
MKIFKLLLIACLFTLTAQAQKKYELASPNGKLKTNITAGKQLTYDIVFNDQQVIAAAPISITLENGEVWGENDKPTSAKRKSVNTKVASPFYRAAEMEDNYNQLVLSFRGNWSVEFRAYNDGIAYRFVNKSKKPFNIANEEVNFQFNSDAKGTVPFVIRGYDGNYESQFFNSFENQYTVKNLSELNKKRLIFLPALVEVENNVKVCFTETDLNNYPGLYLSTEKGENLLSGVFAQYPKELEQGGHNKLQMKIKSRENYIAKVEGPRNFPWRIAVVSDKDIDIANSNHSYLLAEPSRVEATSWIKPGKVAWEWWNCWNIDGVDFNTGVNNATYKAYIDFAGKNGIEYVILDEGWAVNLQADLMQVVDAIDLKELISYAAERNVGIILWAGYYAFERDMENVCKHYSEMGVKGFKVDFMDRDDQMMTDFNFRAAEMCAKYKLLLDLHGTHKPAGLHRTYPNVLNFEGVYGLEQAKWEDPKILDHVTY